MIECEGISKKFGKKTAINHVSIQFKKNGIVGLIGPNGAGKTTFLHMIAGFLEPDTGEIFIGKKNIFDKDASFKKNLYFLPDQLPLYEDFYAKEFLSWIYRMRSSLFDLKNEIAAINHVSEIFDLKDILLKKIKNLSKGQKQRIALASCFTVLPQILLLDEPTEGLDPLQIKNFLDALVKVKENRLIIISSHSLSELEKICDYFVFMNEGIVKECSLEEKNLDQTYFKLLSKNKEVVDVSF